MNLSHSKSLSEIPDFSTIPNLESLLLDHCSSLIKIHDSVGYLTRLVILDIQSCSNLRILPRNLVSKYFTTLDFRGCASLQNFPDIVKKMKYLESLDLSGSGIKELPSSIELLAGLRQLNLSSCLELMYIPPNIYKLLNLKQLLLGGCSKLSVFPKNVLFPKPELLHSAKFHSHFLQICGSLQFPLKSLKLQNCNLSEADFLVNPPHSFSSLESLYLSGNKFVSLPSFLNLRNLFFLDISNCKLLQKIPQLPRCLKKLDASDCKSLVETHGEIMAKIISNNVDNVTLKNLNQFLKYQVEVALPGDDIPDWFSSKKCVDQESISIILTSDTLKKLTAVLVCVACHLENEALELSFELFDEMDFLVGSHERKVFLIKPGNMRVLYLPASLITRLCSPFSSTYKFKVSFSDELKKKSSKVVSMCGIHVLCDQNETGTYFCHLPPIKRRFPDFPLEDAEYMWSICRPETETEMKNSPETQEPCSSLHGTAGRWKQQALKAIECLFFLCNRG